MLSEEAVPDVVPGVEEFDAPRSGCGTHRGEPSDIQSHNYLLTTPLDSKHCGRPEAVRFAVARGEAKAGHAAGVLWLEESGPNPSFEQTRRPIRRQSEPRSRMRPDASHIMPCND